VACLGIGFAEVQGMSSLFALIMILANLAYALGTPVEPQVRPMCDQFLAPSQPGYYFSFYWMATKPEPSKKLSAVLSGAEKLRTSSAFRSASSEKKLMQVVSFIHRYLRFDEGTISKPPRTFSEVLEKGTGNCQHFATLAALILKDSGFAVDFVLRMPKDQFGHVWIEAMDSMGEIFLVDPVHSDRVLTFAQVRKAAQIKSSVAALWYTNSDVQIFPVNN
jgi:hypothetical protein